MSATPGIQLTVWEAGLWAVTLTCAVAFTVNTVRKAVIHGHRERDVVTEPDATFWNIFAGLVVIVPAVIIPALASPAVGLLMLFLAVGAAAASLAAGWKLEKQRQYRSSSTAVATRHDALLARWQRYELDPAMGIDFPGMSDINVPQTATLIRAMREAQRCRLAAGTDYARAVEQLEAAMAEAEAAAGASAPDTCS